MLECVVNQPHNLLTMHSFSLDEPLLPIASHVYLHKSIYMLIVYHVHGD